MKKTLQLLLLSGVALLLAPLADAQVYHAFLWDPIKGMKDLGTLGGSTSYALGINDTGKVCGYSDTSSGTTHAFIWTKANGMVDIGATFLSTAYNYAHGINARGDLAATGGRDEPTHQQTPAFFRFPNKWILPPDEGGYPINYSWGINDLDQLTGQIYSPNPVGFFWDPTAHTFLYLPGVVPGGETVGNAINNLGHITGTGQITDGAWDAFFWTADSGSQDIVGNLGGGYTAGEAINDNDEIAGVAYDSSGILLGFYWSGGTGMNLLQTFGGTEGAAFGITESGQIAGYAANAAGHVHAALWTNHTSAPQDLGTIGGANSYARGLNNVGQVVGYSEP